MRQQFRHPLRAILAAAGAALALGVPALAMGQAAPELSVPAQTTAASSNSIVVPSVTLAEPGYVVVHEGSATEFGADIGATAFMEAGTYSNVEVTLNRDIVDGEYLWPMLHTEDNGNNAYDGAATDSPVSNEANGNANFGGVIVFPTVVSAAQAAPSPADSGNAGLASANQSSGPMIGFLLLGTVALGLLAARRFTLSR